MGDDEEFEPEVRQNRDCIGTRSHRRCNPMDCSKAGTDLRDCDGWETGKHVKSCPKSGHRSSESRPRDPFGLAAYSQEDRDEAASVLEKFFAVRRR